MQNRSIERIGFTTLWAGVLSPIIAQGLWRPLAHFFGSAGTAQQITVAALIICGVSAGVRWLGRAAWHPFLAGGVLAAGIAVGMSLGLAGFGALFAVALAVGGLFAGLPKRLPPVLDGLARSHRLLSLLYVLVACGSVFLTARVSIFIGDPTAVEDQALPGESFVETHSCLSAYVRASELAVKEVDNLYDDSWWHGSLGLPPLPEGVENPYRPFFLDNFSYPPPFLLLVSPLTLWEGDFLAQRAFWFGLNGVFAALGMWIVARWIDGVAAHRTLLLAPLLLGSMPILVVLQIGNFQLAVTVLSLLAMVFLERQRAAAGSALLAMAILSKISPGILGIVLLVQRRFREAILAAGFGVLLFVLSLLRFGLQPIRSFLSFALPRLSSGAAFPFIDTANGLVTNMSPFGIPFKLRFLGFEVGDPWHVGPQIAHVYTIGLLIVAIMGAWRGGDRREQAIRWMSLLVLAGLQSPFCPAYVNIALLWATTLLAVEVRRGWEMVLLIVLWPALLWVPLGTAPEAQVLLSMVHTALTVSVSLWLLLRAPKGCAALLN